MAKSLMDNIGEQGTLGVLQTMSLSDDYDETTRYVKFKAALRQVFPIPLSESIFYEKGSHPRPHTERKEGPLINTRGQIVDDNTIGEV